MSRKKENPCKKGHKFITEKSTGWAGYHLIENITLFCEKCGATKHLAHNFLGTRAI